ncbi:hypothetical protein SALBM135S_09401 [Streptomyces alboniger]
MRRRKDTAACPAEDLALGEAVTIGPDDDARFLDEPQVGDLLKAFPPTEAAAETEPACLRGPGQYGPKVKRMGARAWGTRVGVRPI